MSALGKYFKKVVGAMSGVLTSFNAGKYAFQGVGPHDWETHDFTGSPRASSLFFDSLTPNDGSTPGRPPGTMQAVVTIELFAASSSRKSDVERASTHAELISDALDLMPQVRALKDERGDSVVLGLRVIDIMPVTFAGGRGRPQGVIANIEITY